MRLALDEACTPWADFLDAVRVAVGLAPGPVSTVKLWRKLRPDVLGLLEGFGLHATVERIDDLVPITEHKADVAGLVRVHAHPDPDEQPRRPAISRGPASDDRRAAIGEALRLTADDHLPTRDLRTFLGQHCTVEDEHGPCPALRWLTDEVPCTRRSGRLPYRFVTLPPPVDPTPTEREAWDREERLKRAAGLPATAVPTEPRTWAVVDRSSSCTGVPDVMCNIVASRRWWWFRNPQAWRDFAGHPVMTVDLPPGYDPAAVAVALDGLPLLAVKHPHPVHQGDELLALSWDPNGDLLPAEHVTRVLDEITGEWVDA